MNQICFNGKYLSAQQPVLSATNRGYRYGDGLFETLKVSKGKIALAAYHFERLFSALEVLSYDLPSLFTSIKIEEEILRLCLKNDCINQARVRLSVFRGNGGLYDNDRKLQYLIECWPLEELVEKLNQNGLVVDIYPHARKSCDAFSNLKSASFLPYATAADYAQKNKLNDCFILNSKERIADSTIANIFIVTEDVISTPPLSEGCVNGVMRRYLLENLKNSGTAVKEEAIAIADLMRADEIFLTNAIRGIRWVKQLGDKTYTNSKTVEIFNRLIKTI